MSIDLSKFVRKTDPRSHVNAMSRMPDGRVLATNGWAFAVADMAGADGADIAPADGGVAKKINDALDKFAGVQSWRPIGSIVMPESIRCRYCGGSGLVIHSTCFDCDGDGEFQHGAYLYHCKECDGDGNKDGGPGTPDNPNAVECWKCAGFGVRQNYTAIDGMPAGLGADSRLLLLFPQDAEFCPGDIILLRGDGWQGGLMPMRDVR